MNSGVYVLTFSNGAQYVGKTVNFDRRWKEHIVAMKKGVAAQALQQAYNRNGAPKARKLIECHTDHIDLMETYYICKLQPQLNAVGGVAITNSDLKVLEDYPELLQESTVSHLLKIVKLQEEVTKLTETLQNKLYEHEMYDTVERQSNQIKQLEIDKEELEVAAAINSEKVPWYKRLFGM